jgi:hypothetical protein
MEPKAQELELHPRELPVAWSAVPLVQALAPYPLGDEHGGADLGWRTVRLQPSHTDGSTDKGRPRGTGVGQLARRLIALERARQRRGASPMMPRKRRAGSRTDPGP